VFPNECRLWDAVLVTCQAAVSVSPPWGVTSRTKKSSDYVACSLRRQFTKIRLIIFPMQNVGSPSTIGSTVSLVVTSRCNGGVVDERGIQREFWANYRL
jgi:hypothetical protein